VIALIRSLAAPAAWSAALLSVIVPAAQAADSDAVLARTPLVTMTRGDFDAEMARLTPELREDFRHSPKRVTDLLNVILVNKTLAAQAKREGLDSEPDVQQMIATETTRVLAQRQLRALDEKAGREFDVKADLTTAARERYLVNPERFRRPEEVAVSHILFETSKRGDDEARKLALDARAKVLGGADFNALAAQLSDDPSAKSNHGRSGFFPLKGKMDPTFSATAFALAKVGDISEPVKTKLGWDLIRLDERRASGIRPFDEVKSEIVAEMRQRYITEQRTAALMAIRNDPAIVVNQPALDALSVPPPPIEAPPQKTKP